MRYDIAVIGNDEAAFEILCIAGSSGQRAVGILPEQRHSEWMICLALRRLVQQLLVDRSGPRQSLYARSGTPRLLHRLLATAMSAEIQDHMALLERLGVDLLLGEARLQCCNSIIVTSGSNCRRTLVEAENVVIGSGLRRTAIHPPLGLVPFLRPESLLCGSCLPRRVCLLGGDGLGAGLAALLSLFGVETRLLSSENRSCVMLELAHAAGVVIDTRWNKETSNENLLQTLRSGEVVDCRRAVGFTEHLGLPAVGIEPDEHGQLWCASNLETWCAGVFGIGDVVGFSSDISKHPVDQSHRILNRITHRIRRPHFLRIRAGTYARH